jgi:hypothetical protein
MEGALRNHMNFSKLKFYDLGHGKISATIFFPNEYGASIVQGEGSYGSQKEDNYEIAVLVALKPHPKGKLGIDSKITYNTPITDDVFGYQTREDVERVLDAIAALPSRKPGEPLEPYTGDFTNEDAVLGEIANEIDVNPENLSIREDRGLESFGTGTVYRIENGGNEWMVVENDDQERELALAIVRQDLEHEPEIYQSFIESQVDEKKLREALHSDAYDSNYDMVSDEAESDPESFWKRYEGEGFEAPEEDEDGDRRAPESSEIDELAESLTESSLRDPMAYLEDIYGKADAAKQAVDLVGFDVDRAAEEIVDTDGPAHFLSTYDGQTHETPNGLVYWRRN